MIVTEDVSDFESGNIAQVSVQEGRLGADDSVDLTQRLHRSQISEIDVGWDQVDVPQDEVGVEVDDRLHADVRQIGQVDHEAGHDIEHDAKLVHTIVRQEVDEHVGKAAH